MLGGNRFMTYPLNAKGESTSWKLVPGRGKKNRRAGGTGGEFHGKILTKIGSSIVGTVTLEGGLTTQRTS